MKKVAVVTGATGLVGSRLLSLPREASDYRRVIAMSRRPLGLVARKIELRPADFDRPGEALAGVEGTGAALDVFCCLGTTIKEAGSKSAFRRVDFDYVLALAKWAEAMNVRRFVVVSAIGADAASRVFYLRVKGEIEDALRRLQLPSLTILRPSLLDGERIESRLGERFALRASRPLGMLIPRKLRPVRAVDVAAAMLLAARASVPPSIVPSEDMHGAAERIDRHPSAAIKKMQLLRRASVA
jgi:uncharacterized protein YbjT (DUF2867 family)